MNWHLHRATVDDLDAIMEIETTTFGSDAWSRSMMRAELSNEHTFYVGATTATVAPPELVGYAGLLAPRGVTQADIQTIAVIESARRQGLGHALMRALLTEAESRGATEVFLEVRADNPAAHKVYLGFGFEEIAVRRQYYQPDGIDALVMRLALPLPSADLSAGDMKT